MDIINRLQRKRDEILRFVVDLSLPFDNNGSERDLRMVKLMQKETSPIMSENRAAPRPARRDQ